MQPLVSVLIHETRDGLQAVRCVQELQQQTVASRLEIIVIDNCSRDDSVGILRNRLRRFPNVRIVESPRVWGFGRGLNEGARFASAPYLFINNASKILQRDGIGRLVAKMESDPSIGILAPKLLHDDGTIRTSARTFPAPIDVIAKRSVLRHLFAGRLRRYLQADTDPDAERDVDWVVGGGFLIRRDLFGELRGFDPRFRLFFEDTDLCRRVWRAGKRVVYCPQVSGRDRKRRLSDGGVLALLCTRLGRAHVWSGVRYFRKWGVSVPRKTLDPRHVRL